MSKVTPRGMDMFGPRGPSMAMFNKTSITGEDVKKVREDKRPYGEIAKTYGIPEELVKNLKAKG